MPDIESFRSFMKSAERHGLAGSVADPVKKSLHLKHRWKVFLLEEPTSDEYLVLIQFRSRAGQWDTALFPMEMTCEPGRLLKLLQGKNARLGGSKDEKLEFLRRVIAAIPKRAIKLTSRPGFVNNATGFVMPSRMYGSAEGVFLWDPRAAEDALAKAQGTLEGYQPVLKAALHSPFLTAAILIPLAAPLPSYVKARSHKHLVAEGAIFHWWGDTSSGKTLLSQTTASVFGAPHLSQSFDITARAISEVAARSNDLVVIVDDSEVTDTDAECHKMMALLGRVLPRGYSKAISRVPGKTYPPLTWSCLGVTSGPISSAELARRLGRPRFGQAVRFFDIPVPQSGKGGIFSSKLKGTKEDHVDPSALLDTLTHAISSKFGVLFPAWIDLLLSEELADRTEKLVSRFVRKVGAHAARRSELHGNLGFCTRRVSSVFR